MRQLIMPEREHINTLTPPAASGPCGLRFLCDRMLAGLGKWLRAAGYDTVVADHGAGDTHLLERARREGRILLTCDRRIEKERPPLRQPVVVLASNRIDAAGAELTRRLGLDWQRHVFTRCLCDNALLRPATSAEMQRVPEGCDGRAVMVCPLCHRPYWRGSHTARMQARLAGFARA